MMTNSFLSNAVADVRKYTDEPSINVKYSDADLIRMIEQVYAHVLGEINRSSTQPICARFDVTYIEGTETYRLPELIQNIISIYHKTDSGYKVFFSSRSTYNPTGRGIWVEGKTLHIQSGALNGNDTVTIEYLPTGTARLHNGTCTVDATGTLVTFGETPTDGTLDTHASAYAGSVLRILSSSVSGYNYIQERTITAYNNLTRVATLESPLSPIPVTGTTSYEIAPAINQGLDHVIASYLAYWIAAVEGNTTRAGLLRGVWKDVIRNLRLSAYYSNLQESSKARADNFQNSRFMSGLTRNR